MLEEHNNKNTTKIPLFFMNRVKTLVYGKKGENLLTIAHKNKVDLEGACEGSLACSTCHVIFDKDVFNKLDDISDKEYDLLDQAYGLTRYSRLGCQIKVDDRLRNACIKLPKATRNFAVDGYKPQPH